MLSFFESFKVGDRVWFDLTACPDLVDFKRAVVQATIVDYLEDTKEYEIKTDPHYLPRIIAEKHELIPIDRYKPIGRDLGRHVGQHCIVHYTDDDVYWRAVITGVDPKRLVNDVHVRYEIEYVKGPDAEWVPHYRIWV